MFPQQWLCPAKVNWTLKVGPKRPSGFHQVETDMLALGLHDVLRLRLDTELGQGAMSLTIHGPANSGDIPTDDRNLILRAARLVADRFASEYGELACGLSFDLEKHIPSQAGLGGGSSNAAAAALCLLVGLQVDWSEQELMDWLGELGSDCPFFGHVLSRSEGPGPRTNLALGFDQGQRISGRAEPATGLDMCVITPGVGCPTGAIYAAVGSPRTDLVERPAPRAWSDLQGERCNDLEGPALAAIPALVAWRDALAEYAPGSFQLSGSGSSFYGVIPEGEDGKA
ncbi:MAG: hypothetical protein P1V35_06880, partial [Planctomycetota bacterium]|nr:hypothetical protein [Planctomycetota bacterium]